MSGLYEFAIAKSRLWTLVGLSGGGVLFAFGAGVATGLMIYPSTPLAKVQMPAPRKSSVAAKAAAPVTPPAAAPPTPAPQEAPAPASTAAPAPAAPAPQPAATASARPAATVDGSTTEPALQLAVQAGSYSEKANAERLARLLQDKGYDATVTGRTDARQRTWHVVRLGPFGTWESASKVANELYASHNVDALVRPARF